MKLTGELKKKVEKTENTEQAKKLIEEAGFELTDDEVNAVTGGFGGCPVRAGADDALRTNPELAPYLIPGVKLPEKSVEYDKRPG